MALSRHEGGYVRGKTERKEGNKNEFWKEIAFQPPAKAVDAFNLPDAFWKVTWDFRGSVSDRSASETLLLSSERGDHRQLWLDPFAARGLALHQPSGTQQAEHAHAKINRAFIKVKHVALSLCASGPEHLSTAFNLLSEFPFVGDLSPEANEPSLPGFVSPKCPSPWLHYF